MNLNYDLPKEDAEKLSSLLSPDEKRLYCVPYDIEEDRFVKGFLVVTDRAIYRLCAGECRAVFPMEELSDFRTEILYSVSALTVKRNGSTTPVCRFITGRNLSRYLVICKACELLREGDDSEQTDHTIERFCPKCGHPYIPHTTICPNCFDRREVTRKLWGMTKGLRLMMAFPIIVSLCALALRLVVPWVQAIAINGYVNPANGVIPDEKSIYLWLVVAIVALDMFHRALSVVQSRLSALSGKK